MNLKCMHCQRSDPTVYHVWKNNEHYATHLTCYTKHEKDTPNP